MADIFTFITASGTEAELAALVKALRKYSSEAKEQYNANKDCWYLDTSLFDTLSQESIVELIVGEKLVLTIPGPYGVVRDPYSAYDVLFTELADAAPMAQFDIRIEGFDVGGSISANAILREGRLYFNTNYRQYESAKEKEVVGENNNAKILADKDESDIFSGLTFVVSGDLKKFKNRNAITIYIEERGGTVGGSVTKKTSYLINNAKRSKTANNTKAKDLGIPVLTEKEFLEQFGLEYQPRKSRKTKLYESGYYDPIHHKLYPPRKLKKEPLILQIIFECVDQSCHVLQIDLDVSDYMGLSCTPEMILSCKSLDELEILFLESITDPFSHRSDKENIKDQWRIGEFQTLFMKKWKPVKKAIGDLENLSRITLKRIDGHKEVRIIPWASILHEDLMLLAKNAAICKPEMKEENVTAFETYLDAQAIWYPWTDKSPGWPSRFCGYKEKAKLDWRSLTDDAELFAKMIVSEDIDELDHGEEMTVLDFKTGQYHQRATYFPGW